METPETDSLKFAVQNVAIEPRTCSGRVESGKIYFTLTRVRKCKHFFQMSAKCAFVLVFEVQFKVRVGVHIRLFFTEFEIHY